MRKFLILLVLFGFGCSSDPKKISSIELISYNWDLKLPTPSFKGEFYIQPKLYSILNLDGENESYVCEFSPNKNEIYFHSKIDASIVTALVESLSLIEKNEISVDSYRQDGCMESSPMYRLKVIFSNKEEKFYQYSLREDGKADLAIRKLYGALRVNQIEENYEKMKDTVSFGAKKQSFINFSMHADTLNLPLPPLPKDNKVKFIK
ncbi:hypothetical protein BD847_1250 [Flavobacterium cutihirudinis]|uniref:Lipoprotein n=1 Tax=Flavobacterium cutihirudinis TaxID=1265740 RepID=A0A3D9FWP6_9FLAO|nr:hypothetical protein [Flavobacterium cutihirudinis]RED24522.1 hypothetical protein BD847_1250 [Flavobacterium cutihirudinis]